MNGAGFLGEEVLHFGLFEQFASLVQKHSFAGAVGIAVTEKV